MKKWVSAALFGVALASLTFLALQCSNGMTTRDRALNDMLAVQKLTTDQAEIWHARFVANCLLARQVYQFSFYRQEETKIGKMNVQKYYAMSLKEYGDLIETSWRYNRMMGLPLDGWENYVQLSDWIMESAINPKAEHKTGEIIKLTGYTVEGFYKALYVYKYKSGIGPGHPWYIPELFREGLTEDGIKGIFESVPNAVKFDYAYKTYLMRIYGYDWSWALTAFHFGEEKTVFWKDAGLKMIPEYRIDGKWKGYSMREYYQAVLEIAQGIAVGNMERISRFEATVGDIQRMDAIRSKYIRTYALRLKTSEQCDELTERLEKMDADVKEFKAAQLKALADMAELNDLTLAFRDTKDGSLLVPVAKLKSRLLARYRLMAAGNCAAATNALEKK